MSPRPAAKGGRRSTQARAKLSGGIGRLRARRRRKHHQSWRHPRLASAESYEHGKADLTSGEGLTTWLPQPLQDCVADDIVPLHFGRPQSAGALRLNCRPPTDVARSRRPCLPTRNCARWQHVPPQLRRMFRLLKVAALASDSALAGNVLLAKGVQDVSRKCQMWWLHR